MCILDISTLPLLVEEETAPGNGYAPGLLLGIELVTETL